MNVSNSLSAALFTAALSSLRTANEQPQLALDLIVKSLSGQQATGAAQSLPAEVPRVTSSSAPAGVTGQIIDIHA